MRQQRVSYETYFRNSKTARERFLHGLIKYQGEFDAQKMLLFNPNGDVTCLIKLPLEFAEDFKKEAKVDVLKYKSPTRFDNGTLRPIYSSPEEELEDRKNLK